MWFKMIVYHGMDMINNVTISPWQPDYVPVNLHLNSTRTEKDSQELRHGCNSESLILIDPLNSSQAIPVKGFSSPANSVCHKLKPTRLIQFFICDSFCIRNCYATLRIYIHIQSGCSNDTFIVNKSKKSTKKQFGEYIFYHLIT